MKKVLEVIRGRELVRRGVETDVDVEVLREVSTPVAQHLVPSITGNGFRDVASGWHEQFVEESIAGDRLEERADDLAPYNEGIVKLIDSVFSTSQLPEIENQRKAKSNPLSANSQKREFQELWGKINRKAAYTVQFDLEELVTKCIRTLDRNLAVARLQYTIQRGTQKETNSVDQLKSGEAFELKETSTDTHKASIQSAVEYDLVGRLAEDTKLTRRTIATILQGLGGPTFDQ